MPMTTIQKKKGGATTMTNKPKVKITDEQSKNIMDDLLQELDNKDADELQDVNAAAVLEELNKPIAFNKEEELLNKYRITLESKQEIQVRESFEQQMPVG